VTGRDIRLNPPPFTPQVVFLDLDGTCVDNVPSLNPRIKAAVIKARERTQIVVATGRMFRSGRRWALEMGVDTPLICYQGALVKEMDGDGKVLLANNLQSAPAIRAIEIARAHDWHRQIFVNDVLLAEQDRPEVHDYARVAGVEIEFVDDLVKHCRDGVLKVVYVIHDLDNMAGAQQLMRDELGEQAYITSSLPHLVEVVSPTAGKQKGAAVVCRELGVDPGRSLAVGDAPNDVGLLDFAAFGVAVAPVHEALIDHFDATCAGPKAAGVADVLEACGLA
jgi:Cof subfamily protein (haloacid dehalogenase superfamily)